MTASTARALWFDLPAGARDWIGLGEKHAFRLPAELSSADELAAHDQVTEWDALVGRMIRACLFDDTEDCRRVRRDAEAVAAVTEALAVRLGLGRTK